MRVIALNGAPANAANEGDANKSEPKSEAKERVTNGTTREGNEVRVSTDRLGTKWEGKNGGSGQRGGNTAKDHDEVVEQEITNGGGKVKNRNYKKGGGSSSGDKTGQGGGGNAGGPGRGFMNCFSRCF